VADIVTQAAGSGRNRRPGNGGYTPPPMNTASLDPARPIAILFGTRPEAVKLAPVILELRRRGEPHLVVTTGQHRELVHTVLKLFEIAPDLDLDIMQPGQGLDYVLSRTLDGVGMLLETHQPRAVVVQGDTTSALGATISAFHHDIPVGHVEAGLRSHDMARPFPEEMNRRAISVIARWHFAPTERAARNLAAEGIADGVAVTGNTVVDALQHVVDRHRSLPRDLASFTRGHPYVLATAHRRESWDGGIARVAEALASVLEADTSLRLIFVSHPNPRAREPVERILADHPRARILDSLAYSTFLALLAGSLLAVSDSGGVQEEGPTLGVPVLVTRGVTERPEGLEAGAVRLVGTDRDAIVRETLVLVGNAEQRARMAGAGRAIYGDGRAAGRIVDVLVAGGGMPNPHGANVDEQADG
jgi:UDP-N-acetylglucosamine 2-epimerase (non-hydrolysing)